MRPSAVSLLLATALLAAGQATASLVDLGTKTATLPNNGPQFDFGGHLAYQLNVGQGVSHFAAIEHTSASCGNGPTNCSGNSPDGQRYAVWCVAKSGDTNLMSHKIRAKVTKEHGSPPTVEAPLDELITCGPHAAPANDTTRFHKRAAFNFDTEADGDDNDTWRFWAVWMTSPEEAIIESSDAGLGIGG